MRNILLITSLICGMSVLRLGDIAIAEGEVELREVNVDGCRLSMRLPASWERATDAQADATYADPQKPYWRFWVSTLSPRKLSPAELKGPIEDVVVSVVKGNPAAKSASVNRISQDRALVEYEAAQPGIAPTTNHWWLFERSDDSLRFSLFTLSIHASHVKTTETEQVKALLRDAISRATFEDPARVEGFPLGAEHAPGSASDADDPVNAIVTLMSGNWGPGLTEENLTVISEDAVATARSLQSELANVLRDTGTGPAQLSTAVFSVSLYAGFLQGTRLGMDTIQPFERELARSCATLAGNLQWTPPADWKQLAGQYESARDTNLKVVEAWILAYGKVRMMPDDESVQRLMIVEIEILRRTGVDTTLGRSAVGPAREPWMKALESVRKEMAASVIRLSQRLQDTKAQ